MPPHKIELKTFTSVEELMAFMFGVPQPAQKPCQCEKCIEYRAMQAKQPGEYIYSDWLDEILYIGQKVGA